MFKKINALISTKQKIALIFIFFGNFLITGLEFLSLASIPLIISLIISPDFIESNIPIFKLFIENLIFEKGNYKNLFVLIFFLFLIKNLFLGIILFLEAKFAFNLRTSLTNKLFKKYLEMPYLFHANSNPGKLIRNVVVEVGYCCSVISQILIVFREVLLLLIISLLLILYNELIILPVLFVLGTLISLFFYLIKKTIKNRGKSTQVRRAIINTKVNELINGIKEIKVFSKQKIILKNFKKIFYLTEFNSFFIKVINSFPKLILEMTGVAFIVILYLIYDYLNYQVLDFLPILSLIAVSSIRAIPSISSLVVCLNNIIFQSPAVNLVHKDLSLTRLDMSSDINQNISPFFKKRILLKDVTFKYPGRKKNVIDKMSIEIKRGKKIGIIGSSGSGKSTLINLILGLIKPSKGSIYIDDKKLEDLNLNLWRKQIGYVSQNIFLIDDNIKNNIAFGENLIKKNKLDKALKKSNLFKFVKTLPNKELTNIGNNGIKVSGGQHQRIGIARALYNEPKIFIMDEATSSLDFKTEDEIVKDLNLKKSNLTAIIVSHRPRSVENCDIVYYLEKGKVKDFGKYKYLLKKYKKLKS